MQSLDLRLDRLVVVDAVVRRLLTLKDARLDLLESSVALLWLFRVASDRLYLSLATHPRPRPGPPSAPVVSGRPESYAVSPTHPLWV